MSFFWRTVSLFIIILICSTLFDLYKITFSQKEGLVDVLLLLGILVGALILLLFFSRKKAPSASRIEVADREEAVESYQPVWDTIQIIRMKRNDETKWQNAKSWLGGLPSIDPKKWPRNPESGLPLHHIAHVDLTELPYDQNIPNLPKEGTLSFFADTELEDDDIAAAVVYTSANNNFSPTLPPDDCPPLHGENWGYSLKCAPNKADAARVFRRWPIEFILVPLGKNVIEFGPAPSSIHIFSDADTVDWQAGKLIDKIAPSDMPWQALVNFQQHFQKAKASFPACYEEYSEEIDGYIEKVAAEAMPHEPGSLIGISSDKVNMDIIELRKLTDRYQEASARKISPMRDSVLAAFREMQNSSLEVQSRIPEDVIEYLRWEQVNTIPSSQYPWETVTRLMNSYKQSLNGFKNRDRDIEELKPAHDMVSKWSILASKHNAHLPIGPVVESLEMEMEQLRKECKIRPEYGDGTSALRATASEVYLDMMVSSQDIYEKIPALIRSYFDNNRRRSAWDSDSNNVHTMFGQFQMVQSSPDEFGDDIPLIQLQSDDMMDWCWGDVGSIAIGISPKDLKKAKWHKAWGLFQGH